MTRFTVTWTKAARGQLAETWLGATPSKRNAITAASFEIDKELAIDPGQKGEPLSEGLRRLVCRPLVAIFEVKEADRLVEVGMIGRLIEDA